MRQKLPVIAFGVAACCGLTLSALRNGSPGSLQADTSGSLATKHQKADAKELPFVEDFSNPECLDGWTVINNNSQCSWEWEEHKESVLISQYRVADETGCDNWLITPAFHFEKGMAYRLSFDVLNWLDSDLHIYLLKSSDNPEEEKIPIYDYIGEEWGIQKADFEVSADGVFYIGFHDTTPFQNNGTSIRYSVEIDDLKIEQVGNNSVPEAPGNLTQVPGKNGEISMGLEWTNPVYNLNGEKLDALSSVTVYVDGVKAEVFNKDVIPGAEMTWTDPNPKAGSHTYSVVAANTSGASMLAAVSTFIGIDFPGAPENLSVDYDKEAGTITLDWEQPQFGLRGGWYDSEGISYRVVRQPGNKVLETNLADETFEDTDLDQYGNYVYQVTTRTASGQGGTSVTKGIMVESGTVPLPLAEGWENAESVPLWTIVDNNNDDNTLVVSHSGGFNSATAIGFPLKNVNMVWDETLYSPPVYLEKGKTYRTSVYVMNAGSGGWNLLMTYGKEKTQSAQKNTVFSIQDGYSTSWSIIEEEFTAKESGAFYFAWRLYDATVFVWLDEFRIEEILSDNIEATAVNNLNNAPSPGEKLTTGVTYTNRGFNPTSPFKVQLLDDDNNVLGEENVSRPVASGASGTANVKWTVPSVVGDFAIRGKVIMDKDMCDADNETLPVVLDVQKEGVKAISIGSSTKVSDMIPFRHYGNIYSEFIYKGEDFNNIAGLINSMAFKVRFGMTRDYQEIPFRLYIGNTDLDNLYSGWIPEYMLTEVFNGKLDLNRGVYDLKIDFDKPFEYSGGNICVLLVGDNDYRLMMDGYGMASYVSDYADGATRTLSEGHILPESGVPEQNKGDFLSIVPNVVFYVDHSATAPVSGVVTDNEGNPLEGVEVSGAAYNTGNMKALTDKEGRYEFPYHPVGYAMFNAFKRGYENGFGYEYIAVGEPAVVNITMDPLKKIILKGSVTDAADGRGIENAILTISGDNEFIVKTDSDGRFEIDGIYAFKEYPVFNIEAEGYSPVSYGGIIFREDSENPYIGEGIELEPLTASPYSVNAIDKGESAVISWEKPIENVNATKSNDILYGHFGGAYEMSIGHRYTHQERQSIAVDGKYYIQSISFVPTCCSDFSIAIWEGEPGNESMVYLESVTPKSYGNWNEFRLSEPYKMNPEKSVVVGYVVNALNGAYPIGFDNGPATEGGDCLFDSENNGWTTARNVLPGSMNNNWSIRVKFGNNHNYAVVPWADSSSELTRAVRIGNTISIDEVAGIGKDMNEESVSNGEFAMIKLSAPVAYAPMAGVPSPTDVKGYYVYRFEPGQEGMSYEWTKLNENPLTETSFEDKSWNVLENKPYRFAVESFYGNIKDYGKGVVSAPTYSDGVDKGRYATVTVEVVTDNGSAEGVTVILNGDGKSVVKEVCEGESSVVFENVRYSSYSILAMKPFYERGVADIEVNEKEASAQVRLTFASPEPTDFEAVDYIRDTRLSWQAPNSAVTKELTVSNRNIATSFSFTTGMEDIVGQISTPEMRKDISYGDFYFDAIEFYANAALTYSPLLWEENKFGQQTQIARVDYTVEDYEVGSWIKVKLDRPVHVDPEKTYFFGYAVTPEKNTAPFVLDDNFDDQGYGCYMYLLDQKDYKYRWMMTTSSGCWTVVAHVTDTPNPDDMKKADVKFDIYRFAANDSEDESKWTKLTSEPVESEIYVDQNWQTLENTDWRYGVKALFNGGAESAPALSKILPKGMVSLLSADISTNNGESPRNARLTLSKGGKVTYSAEADADGHIEIPEVKKGASYSLRVFLPAFEEEKQSLKVSDDETRLALELKEIKECPGFVEAFPAADNASVELKWRAPGEYAPREGWAYWDNNEPLGGYGTSSGFCAAAQLFTPEDQKEKGMSELDITRISFFPTQSDSNPVSKDSRWIAKIWRVNSDMTVDEVATADADNVVLNKWNEVELTTPYHVSGDENLLIGYEFHGSGNALGVDVGPTVKNKGDWANFGNGWQTLQSVDASFNFNNLIHAYCENLYVTTGKRAPALSESQRILTDGEKESIIISKADRASRGADHMRLPVVEYPVKGYLIYRVPASEIRNESAWTLLNAEPVEDTAFVDSDWKNAGTGRFTWGVKAVYASGESDAAICGYTIDENGNVSGVEIIGTENMSIRYNAPDRLIVSVPAAGSIAVSEISGRNILTSELDEGVNELMFRAAEGVYIFRVTYGEESHSFKYLIK